MIHLSSVYIQVIVLCFAVFFGSLTPHNMWSRPSAAYSTSSGMGLRVSVYIKANACMYDVAESLLVDGPLSV